MASLLRVGIVGCGRILNAHLNGYKDLLGHGIQDFQITALCARNAEDARRFIAPGGPPPRPPVSPNPDDPLNASHVYLTSLFSGAEIQVWTDPFLMIDEADIDVVDITTSVFAHHPIATYALSRDKHVMVQKPIAISVASAKQMVAAATDAGMTLAVMEDMHYQPAVLMARWLVESGRLGTIQMVLAAYLGTQQWSPNTIVAGTPWRHRIEQTGGGISFDLGVHFFQHLRRVCGPIERVYGSIRTLEPIRYMYAEDGTDCESIEVTVDDTMFCQIEFVDGGVGHLSASWAGHGIPIEIPGGMVIYGSKGCLQGERLYLDGYDSIGLNEFFGAYATDQENELLFPLGIRDPFAQSYLDFFRAIGEKRSPSYDGIQGMIDLAWCAAVVKSSQEKIPLTAQVLIDQAEQEEKGGISHG